MAHSMIRSRPDPLLVSRAIRICVRMLGARARKGRSGKNTYGVNDRFLCVRGMQLTLTSQRSQEVSFGCMRERERERARER